MRKLYATFGDSVSGEGRLLSTRPAKITAVGHNLPERRITNKELEQTIDTSDAWIVERTGIRERRVVSEGQATSDLAAAAAMHALGRRGMDAADLDLIIVATVTPDMFFPSTACLVQKKIGAKKAWRFDLSGACSGFLYALETGRQFVSAGTHSKGLVIGADVMSSIIDFQDRATCVLFGDGAGAVLLEPAEDGECGIMDSILRSDGSGGQYLFMPAGGSLHPATAETVARKMHYVHQDGRNVFKFAVRGMAEISEEILTRHNLCVADLKLYVPHQANLRISEAVQKELGLRPEQVYNNIQRYGNTTSGTIPIALDECVRAGRLKPGDVVVFTAFGSGFVWGSCILRW